MWNRHIFSSNGTAGLCHKCVLILMCMRLTNFALGTFTWSDTIRILLLKLPSQYESYCCNNRKSRHRVQGRDSLETSRGFEFFAVGYMGCYCDHGPENVGVHWAPLARKSKCGCHTQ